MSKEQVNAHTRKVMLAFAQEIKNQMPEIDYYVDHEWQSGAWIFFAKDLFKAVPVIFKDSSWFKDPNMAKDYHATLEYYNGKTNELIKLNSKAEFDKALKIVLNKLKNL
jgi:hypothetical protein